MKKCVVIPDSFKGTISALEVCQIMKERILLAYPQCEVISVPIADGGEGTVECFLHALGGGEKIVKRTSGPFGEEIDSFYGVVGDCAVIEMAASAGLTVAKGKMNPAEASTYGVGELMVSALAQGCKRMILGLGGSCTNDGGAGMAAAMGVRFMDKTGASFLPVGGTLSQIQRIDISAAKRRLSGVQITAMCDIDNPLYGLQGAAHIFAPQKGADRQQVEFLDQQLRCFAEVIQDSLSISVDHLPGGGAAGGMGAGVYALLGAELLPGIDVLLDLVRFEEILAGCDAVFTGEGKLDAQSMGGKAVIGISRRAKRMNVPVVAVVGTFEGTLAEVRREGVLSVFETANGRGSFEEIKAHCKNDLRDTMDKVCREVSFPE